MSKIFDALQRSESERLGRNVSTATELLEIAEDKAAKAKQSRGSEDRSGGLPVYCEKVSQIAPTTGVSGETGLPFVGKQSVELDQFKTIQVSASPDSRLVCLTDSDSLATEKFRFLSVRLQQVQRTRPLKTVLITSSMPGEGKSMVAANLACTLARKTQKKVLLVDGDLRRPSLVPMFGLRDIPGLSECLEGKQNLMTSVYRLQDASLSILAAGNASCNPLELLQTKRLPELMDQLKDWFDWIIIDSPPVLAVADTSVFMRLVDGIIVVARQGVTEKKQLEKGIETLEKKKLIGAVLNCSQSAAHGEYYYQYYSSRSSSRV